MDYRKFGKTDLKVSMLGMGTWQASLRGWGKDYSKESMIMAIRESFENGINFFDTAEIYGDGISEKILSEALSIYNREDYIIATKIAPFNLNNAEKSIDNSLKRLNSKYIDLYQIHWPPSIYSKLDKLIKPLNEIVKEGKARYIGVSNFDENLIKKFQEYDLEIVSNQIRYSLLREYHNKSLIEYMKKYNIEVIAYSPLEMGALTGKYGKYRKPNGYVRKNNGIFRDLEKLEKLNSFLLEKSKKYNCTISQLSLSYIIGKGHLPIPGAKTREQARENAMSFSIKIIDEDIKEIDNFVISLNIDPNNFFSKIKYIPSFIIKFLFPKFI
ncbi:MAG: aldo/keto reductase [Thermoplasmata archaeon]|nr:aldo/keto reductase [Staphylococcus epidermidis]